MENLLVEREYVLLIQLILLEYRMSQLIQPESLL